MSQPKVNSPVILYTKPTCGFCHDAKQLLASKGVDYIEIDVSSQPEVREKLIARTNHRTVPMIFVNEHFIGGYTELNNMNDSGDFDTLYAQELAKNQKG